VLNIRKSRAEIGMRGKRQGNRKKKATAAGNMELVQKIQEYPVLHGLRHQSSSRTPVSPSEKSFTISGVVSRATSIKQITNEIKKCDVLCVNCHAKRHWREMHETDSWEEILPEE